MRFSTRILTPGKPETQCVHIRGGSRLTCFCEIILRNYLAKTYTSLNIRINKFNFWKSLVDNKNALPFLKQLLVDVHRIKMDIYRAATPNWIWNWALPQNTEQNYRLCKELIKLDNMEDGCCVLAAYRLNQVTNHVTYIRNLQYSKWRL